ALGGDGEQQLWVLLTPFPRDPEARADPLRRQRIEDLRGEAGVAAGVERQRDDAPRGVAAVDEAGGARRRRGAGRWRCARRGWLRLRRRRWRRGRSGRRRTLRRPRASRRRAATPSPCGGAAPARRRER